MSRRVPVIVQKQGISFVLTSEAPFELRWAGATPEPHDNGWQYSAWVRSSEEAIQFRSLPLKWSITF